MLLRGKGGGGDNELFGSPFFSIFFLVIVEKGKLFAKHLFQFLLSEMCMRTFEYKEQGLCVRFTYLRLILYLSQITTQR